MADAKSGERRTLVSGAKEPWHLDKRVPIVLILTLAAQSCAVIWYASKLDSRVAYLEEQVAARSMVNERLARMEERFEAIKDDVSDVKQSQMNIERMVRYLTRQSLPPPDGGK